MTEDFGGRWHFNTSIAAIMELINELYAYEDSVQARQAIRPHRCADRRRAAQPGADAGSLRAYLAHELWEMLGETSDLLRAPWPQYDPALAKEEEVEIGIQVNGKVRSRIVVAADAGKSRCASRRWPTKRSRPPSRAKRL